MNQFLGRNKIKLKWFYTHYNNAYYHHTNATKQTKMMPTLNTDCWGEIKGFLLFEKDERRQTPHAAAMKEMIKFIDDNVTIENGVTVASIDVWLTYGNISLGDENALDSAGAWDQWSNGAGGLLAPALFTRIIEAKTDPITLARFIAATEDWKDEIYASDDEPDYDSIEQPVTVNAWH